MVTNNRKLVEIHTLIRSDDLKQGVLYREPCKACYFDYMKDAVDFWSLSVEVQPCVIN